MSGQRGLSTPSTSSGPSRSLGIKPADPVRDPLSALTCGVIAGSANRPAVALGWIVLLAADGVANTAIAARVVWRPTVITWRNRYVLRGIAGLEDQARSGRPRTLDHAKIGAVTLKPPPKKYGVTHWRIETFKFSTDPELVGKVSKRLAGCQVGSNEPTWQCDRRVRVPPPDPRSRGPPSGFSN